MGLVRDWRRQTARAAGVSLIAPVALLLAATVVAASGGGLGGVGSLSQLASGPALPDPGLASLPEASLDDTQYAVELGPPPSSGAPAAAAPATPPALGPSPAPTPTPIVPDASDGGGSSDVAVVPETGVTPDVASPASPPPPVPAPAVPEVPPAPPPPPPNPVDRLLNDTRDIVQGTNDLVRGLTEPLPLDLDPFLGPLLNPQR